METRRHLPQEIIHEILTRASVKSLLRFKCVSKSWCTLISDESFVKAHLFKSSKDRTFVCVKPAKSYDKAPPLWSPPLLSCEPLNSYSYLYDQSLGLLERAAPVVRSCGGLVCCFSISGKDFTLWNPSTRKCRKLPSVDFEKGIDGSPTSCGFGYVESNDDYKVFALSLQQRIEGAYHCVAKVYSLKTDCWRTVDDKYELKTPMDLTARHLGGMLYWLRPFVIKGNRFRWEIISFDLEKEAFGITVEQPGEDLVDGSYTPQLGVLHDNLCMLCSSVTGDIVILQLKQHTWTRMATVPLPYSRGPRFPTNLLGVGSNGSILRAHDLHIVLCYRPNPTFIRRLWIDDFDILNRACAHVESLVSLGNPEEDAGTCESVRNLEMVSRAEHRRWWLIMT